MCGLKALDMKVKSFLFVVLYLLILGCSSPMDKSVMTPLTSKEIDKVAGKDPSFLATLSVVEEKSNYIVTANDSARWNEVTYGRVHKFLSQTQNPQIKSSLYSNLRDEWEKIYLNNNKVADSIIAQWGDFIKNNCPDSLVAIRHTGTETVRISSKKKIDIMVKVELQLTPLKFPIDSVNAIYSFVIPNDTLTREYHNTLNHNKRFRETTERKMFLIAPENIKEALSKNDTSCIFKYKLISVHSEGKCYHSDSIFRQVPISVQKYFTALEENAESNIFDEMFYREQIIKELVNPVFLPQSVYVKTNAENHFRQLDTLVYSYTTLNANNKLRYQ